MGQFVSEIVLSKQYHDQIISLPSKSKILSVINKFDNIVLCVMVHDDVKSCINYEFRVVKSHVPIDFNIIPPFSLTWGKGFCDGMSYTHVGTINLHDGEEIYHVFGRISSGK